MAGLLALTSRFWPKGQPQIADVLAPKGHILDQFHEFAYQEKKRIHLEHIVVEHEKCDD
jgi:hypothetical protein